MAPSHRNDEPQPADINERSRVPIGWMWAAICAAVATTASVLGFLYHIDTKVTRIEYRQQQNWTVGKMSGWAQELGARNKSLDVPPVIDYQHPDSDPVDSPSSQQAAQTVAKHP